MAETLRAKTPTARTEATAFAAVRPTPPLGVNRIYDLMQGGSAYYKTGANSLNPATGTPNWVCRYTDPVVTNFSATVRF
jgi:hypothetical protein